MAGEQLLQMLALAMVFLAAAVEGCRSTVCLLGPLEDTAVDARCEHDRVKADGWGRGLRQWRQHRAAVSGELGYGAGLL